MTNGYHPHSLTTRFIINFRPELSTAQEIRSGWRKAHLDNSALMFTDTLSFNYFAACTSLREKFTTYLDWSVYSYRLIKKMLRR
jgi:hypothetical protein